MMGARRAIVIGFLLVIPMVTAACADGVPPTADTGGADTGSEAGADLGIDAAADRQDDTCNWDDDCDGADTCDPFSGTCGPYVEAGCGRDGDDSEGNAIDPNGTDSKAYDLNLGLGDDQRTTVTVENLASCMEDLDFFAFEITEDGHGVTVAVELATDGAIGALFAFDLSNSEEPVLAADTKVEDPELILTHGSAGAYLLVVQLQPEWETDPQSSGYTLTAIYHADGCTGIGSCRDSAFGDFCADGVCGGVEGEGTVLLGGACDSSDDCIGFDAAVPTAVCYLGGADPASWVCVSTTDCTEEGAAACGTGFFCNDQEGYCVPNCETDEYCDVSFLCDDEGAAGSDECISRACLEDSTCTDRSDRPTDEVCVLSNTEIYGQCLVPEDPPSCAGDDGNDRDATATTLALSGGTGSSSGAALCDGDIDVYKVTITEAGRITATIAHDGPTGNERAADLDAVIIAPGAERASGVAATYPDEGTTIIEEGEARFAAPGDYLIRVIPFGELGASIEYALAVAYEAEACSSDADCAVTWPLHAVCNPTVGSCEDFEGNDEQDYGQTCDDDRDCKDGLFCYIDGEGTAQRHYCTPLCFSNHDCHEGDTCVELEYNYLREGYCDVVD